MADRARVLAVMVLRSRVLSATVRGVDAELVFVEVALHGGVSATAILGLPDTAVRESRDRVRAAIHASGLDFPQGKILVNLAPAHTRKEGPWFDLPIALAVLSAAGMLPTKLLAESLFVGELALDGGVRATRGALSVALAARRHGLRRLFIATPSASVASLVEGLEVIPAPDLASVVSICAGMIPAEPVARESVVEIAPQAGDDDAVRLEDVVGQAMAKRALLVAAAGGHNLLFVGPPGAGKSMLARRLPAILPPPSWDEALEITQLHDLVRPGAGLRRERPFRAPHHTVSRAGLVGGGSDLRPGEVALAHRGVLFLDELPEFPRECLEALRQPLEDGRVVLSRAAGTVTYPARFQLIAAMNPCPCGWRGHPLRPSTCLPRDVARHGARLSGPLLDRIDLAVAVAPIAPSDLGALSAGPARRDGLTTADARSRSVRARVIQHERSPRRGGAPAIENARLAGRAFDRHCATDAPSRALLDRAMERLGLTMRAYSRTLRVARTIADLEGTARIGSEHVAEALGYRLPAETTAAR